MSGEAVRTRSEPPVTVAAIVRAGLVGFMVGTFGLWLHALLTSA
jgi:hypothetical protein